jgi:hypothetical protein
MTEKVSTSEDLFEIICPVFANVEGRPTDKSFANFLVEVLLEMAKLPYGRDQLLVAVQTVEKNRKS